VERRNLRHLDHPPSDRWRAHDIAHPPTRRGFGSTFRS
jgi:hypothetical protein